MSTKASSHTRARRVRRVNRTGRRAGGSALGVAALVASTLLVPAAAYAAATPSARIVGTVTAFDGTQTVPVPGVLVQARANSATFDQRAVQAVTAADGSYRLPGVLPWEYTVCFVLRTDALRHLGPTGLLSHCHGGDPQSPPAQGTPVTAAADTTTVVDEDLPRGAAVQGTVVDEKGVPVVGGTVTGENLDEYDTVSGPRGRYLLKGMFGTAAQMCAYPAPAPAGDAPGSAGRCASPSTPLTPGAVTTAALSLVPGGGLRGRVLDTARHPVGGALVTAYGSTTVTRTTTAGDGTWAIGQLEPTTATVCVTPPPGGFLLPACAGAGPGTPQPVTAGRFTAVSVTLPVGVAVHGTVSDRNGRPLAGVQVFVSGAGPSVVTGPDGTFALPPTSLRTVCATVQPAVSGNANGYLDTCVDLAPAAAGNVRQDVRLAVSGALAGRVTDRDGRPVAGIGIVAIGFGDDNVVDVRPAVTTGADGRYVVRNLPAENSYEIDVDPTPTDEVPVVGRGAPAGYLSVDPVTGLVVTPPGRTTVPTVQLSPASGVDIRIVDADGRPVTRAAARISLDPGSHVDRAADANGRVLFANQPAETVQVCALAVTPGPRYPTGLRPVCRTVTTRLGVLTPLTLRQPAVS